jgi:phenylacetate-CoA ligase
MYHPDIEMMERPKLEALQFERLKKIVKHAYDNVQHYRTSFDKSGVKPDDLRSLEDIARFPFTTKYDLRDNYPFGMFAVPREKIKRFHASSGTTGKPTVVGYTKEDLETWSGLMARTLVAAGVRPNEVVHNALGYGLFTGGLGFHYGAERLGCTVTPMSGGNTEKQILLIQDLKATVLFATPSYALNIAEVAEKDGCGLSKTSLRLAVFGGEPWSEEMRSVIDKRMGVRCQDTYGLSEICGPGVSGECEEQSGLHGWEDHFLFEVIDQDTLQPVPYGQPGELVITTLTKEALPMIRYRTRDISTINPERCACRTHVRLSRISGRNDDMLIIRGVNVFPSQIEAVMVGRHGVSPHYRLLAQKDGVMDTLTVEVEAEPEIVKSQDAYDNLARGVQHHIKTMVGITCRVVVLSPGEIPRSVGKAVRVFDERLQQIVVR